MTCNNFSKTCFKRFNHWINQSKCISGYSELELQNKLTSWFSSWNGRVQGREISFRMTQTKCFFTFSWHTKLKIFLFGLKYDILFPLGMLFPFLKTMFTTAFCKKYSLENKTVFSLPHCSWHFDCRWDCSQVSPKSIGGFADLKLHLLATKLHTNFFAWLY